MCYHCEMCFLSVGFAEDPFVAVALENKAKRSGSWRSNFCPSRAIESSIIYLVKGSKDVVSSSGVIMHGAAEDMCAERGEEDVVGVLRKVRSSSFSRDVALPRSLRRRSESSELVAARVSAGEEDNSCERSAPARTFQLTTRERTSSCHF